MAQKILWFLIGALTCLVLFVLLGGLYTVTPPNGPANTAYKINRLTGKVWLLKTYPKQIGPIRVLTAREAAVEETKQLAESDIPPSAGQAASYDRRR